MSEKYFSEYMSPAGRLFMESSGDKLSGLSFDDKKHEEGHCSKDDIPVFEQTRVWLDTYFSGNVPDFTPPLEICGSDFFVTVSRLLLTIPYGKTVTYGEIAKKAAALLGRERMSAQAVGGAVGRNKIAIIVPCHRVIGADRGLTGYAAGLDKKIKLLKIEGALL